VPVNLLYCEGGSKSPDIRLLTTLLAGICTVEPVGSKYGLGQAIRLARAIRTGSVIAGLRDRDFDENDALPAHTPQPWRVENDTIWLGWYWERKEIENYLIDPLVVTHALGTKAPDIAAYTAALQTAAMSVADYTAARTALTCCRVRFVPLDNSWGTERGRDKHKFPDDRQEADCRQSIGEVVRQYQQDQIVQEADVLNNFDALLPACRPGGQRFQGFLTFFAGKDLLWAMQTDLERFNLGTPRAFRERILVGIENSPEDVWTWLAEWQQLRDFVKSISSNKGI
jgi:hypothetical protein